MKYSENTSQNDRIKTHKKRLSIGADYNLIAIVVILCAIGLVMVYSTSYYTAVDTFGDRFYYLRKQLIATFVGLILMLFISKIINVKYLNSKFLIYFFLFFSLFLMLLVLSPLGFEAYGARRWISIPVFGSVQPSELFKIAYILFISWYLSRRKTDNSNIKTVIHVAVISMLFVVYIWKVTDHLSAGIIVFLIGIVMSFVANKNTVRLSIFFVAVISIGYLFLRFISKNLVKMSNSFRINRILVWTNPEEYIDRGGYQIIQALYAIGSAGFIGRGLGKSTQKLGFIPEAQNDMIIAIFCEELGILGLIVLLMLFGYLLYRLLLIAKNCEDLFSFLVVVGIFAHISIQTVLNFCVVLNVIPTTGITMPFISYGGSSIVFLLSEIGLALALSNRIKRRVYKDFN